MQEVTREPLTDRERSLALLMALPDKEIAERLGLQLKTIQAYKVLMLTKTQSRNRIEMVLNLIQHYGYQPTDFEVMGRT